MSQTGLPHRLLRDRLALLAATACVAFSGRSERAGELRDAVHLLRPGDLPGPAGETYLAWRRAAERRITPETLVRALPEVDPDRIRAWLDAGTGAPVQRASRVLEAVLADDPRAETAALILADAALSRALGQDRIVPLLATGLRQADLRRQGDELRLAVHCAATASARDAARLANDLRTGAARLEAVAPRLRAKGAREALDLFLKRDAVLPAALPLPDRAARRFCDRLVALGVVRELTGRDTFRLYGL